MNLCEKIHIHNLLIERELGFFSHLIDFLHKKKKEKNKEK